MPQPAQQLSVCLGGPLPQLATRACVPVGQPPAPLTPSLRSLSLPALQPPSGCVLASICQRFASPTCSSCGVLLVCSQLCSCPALAPPLWRPPAGNAASSSFVLLLPSLLLEPRQVGVLALASACSPQLLTPCLPSSASRVSLPFSSCRASQPRSVVLCGMCVHALPCAPSPLPPLAQPSQWPLPSPFGPCPLGAVGCAVLWFFQCMQCMPPFAPHPRHPWLSSPSPAAAKCMGLPVVP
jgi:hypothetical protein